MTEGQQNQDLDSQVDPGGPTRQRALELKQQGLELGQAWNVAFLEHRIEKWPASWGDDLIILIYGDFEPPNEVTTFPALGITVHPERVTNSVIRSATCVLKATVRVREKNVQALIDASRRINVLLGSWTLVTWGNSGCGWWSYVTHGTGGGVRDPFDHEDLHRAVEGVLLLSDAVRRRVDAALYWIREPRKLLMEFQRRDDLRIYAAYWNAFECLVHAVITARPPTKTTKGKRQQEIDNYFSKLTRKPTASDIDHIYTRIVNTGFVGQASYALQVCFGPIADTHINECFHLPNKRDRLYDIRNAINHGEIDAENPIELTRVGSRLQKLWLIVWGMFGRLVPFPAPIDREASTST